MTLSDLLTLILQILLLICIAGIGFGVYVWYLDRLWTKHVDKARRALYDSFEDLPWEDK